MELSPSQRQTFAERGLLRLDELIPDEVVAPARALVLQVLEREGVWRAGAWVAEPADWVEKTRLFRMLKGPAKSPAFKSLQTADLLDAVNQLVDGRAVQPARSHPQLLFTPPGGSAWTVPHKVWHLDVPRLGEVGLPGVQMFSFLDTVAPGAGGTLLVAGSHRLLNDRGRIRSKDVKSRLKQEPYFRELFHPREGDPYRLLAEPGHVGDVELQVVELHGDPGDVYLTDLRLLHTLAPNASRTPRLMVTQRYFLQSLLARLMRAEAEAPEGGTPPA
jgi:hypothetical protein